MNPFIGLWRSLLGLVREFGPPPGPPGPPGPYHAYTRDFDIIVDALELDQVLGPPSPFQAAELVETRTALHHGLMAWRASQHLRAAELSAAIRETLDADSRADTIVTLLFDQSGSMRGQKALFCTAAADVCQEFLSGLGIRVEVLGFTTARWRGGRSRRRWIWQGFSRDPGRLNDLLTSSTGPPTIIGSARAGLPSTRCCGPISTRRTSTARPCSGPPGGCGPGPSAARS